MSSASDNSTRGSVNKWVGLVAASTGIFLGSLDITVNVALPNITSSFGADVQTVQWIIIFYVGSSAGLQISLGSAADAYGLKRFFIIGLVVYTLAVLLISLAPLLQIVFGLRVLQAVGNGLLMACAPALVTSMFPREERGKALGLMAGLGTMGMLVGTLAGGVLVDSFGWRAIFAARVPLGVCAIALSLVTLAERASPESQRGFDLKGAFTLFTGLVSFILFLTLGGRMGWTSPVPVTLALLSLGSLVTFVYVEGRARLPVLDVGLLRHRVLAPAFISAYLISMSSFVNWFILPFFVSDVMGANAKTWGMLMMLMPLTVAASAPIGGWVSDRVPPAYVNTVAAVMTAGTVFSYVMLGEGATVFDVAWRSAAMGVSMGLHQASNANLVMGSVPSNRLGTGGAIMTLSRSMGSVSSVGILSALLASRQEWHVPVLAGLGVVGSQGDLQAFILAFQDTYLVAALVGAAAAVASVTYWPRFLR